MKNSFDTWQRSLRLPYLLKSIANGKKRLISSTGETSGSLPDRVKKLIFPLYSRTLSLNGTTATENHSSSLLSKNGTSNKSKSNGSSLHNQHETICSVLEESTSSIITDGPVLPSAVRKIEPLVRQMLIALGVDVNSEDFRETSLRHAKFIVDFCTPIEFNFTTFRNTHGYREMILEKNIEYFSLCPHHLLPIFGAAVVSYIPSDRYAGLSKVPRTVTFCSRGMKTQEQITLEIAKHIEKETGALGVAVYLEGKHFCMVMRGAKMKDVSTETYSFLGKFQNDNNLRNEFLSRINNSSNK